MILEILLCVFELFEIIKSTYESRYMIFYLIKMLYNLLVLFCRL